MSAAVSLQDLHALMKQHRVPDNLTDSAVAAVQPSNGWRGTYAQQQRVGLQSQEDGERLDGNNERTKGEDEDETLLVLHGLSGA